MSLHPSIDPAVLRWRMLALATWLAGAVLTGVIEERRDTPASAAFLRLGVAVFGPMAVTNAAAIWRASRSALTRAHWIFASSIVVGLVEICTRGVGRA